MQGIANGSTTIEEIWIWLNDRRTWIQNNNDPDLFHCKDEDFTLRRDEPLPDEKQNGEIFLFIAAPEQIAGNESDINTITFK